MKEKVLVSACLLGVNCKYDGTNNKNEKLMKYLEGKEVIPICPEQLGGLTTPRPPAERKGRKVVTEKGDDVTKNYQKGAEETQNLAKQLNITKAILKERSPSCGTGEIYDGTFHHKTKKAQGVTAELLMQNGMEVISSDRFQ